MLIRKRIDALTGWDKKADDLLTELYDRSGNKHRLWIESYGGSGCIVIVSHGTTLNVVADGGSIGSAEYREHWSFNDQCEKLNAFKKVLLWLFNEGDIRKDEEKNRKIDVLKQQLEEMQEQVRELEKC